MNNMAITRLALSITKWHWSSPASPLLPHAIWVKICRTLKWEKVPSSSGYLNTSRFVFVKSLFCATVSDYVFPVKINIPLGTIQKMYLLFLVWKKKKINMENMEIQGLGTQQRYGYSPGQYLPSPEITPERESISPWLIVKTISRKWNMMFTPPTSDGLHRAVAVATG